LAIDSAIDWKIDPVRAQLTGWRPHLWRGMRDDYRNVRGWSKNAKGWSACCNFGWDWMVSNSCDDFGYSWKKLKADCIRAGSICRSFGKEDGRSNCGTVWSSVY
jgi:hypothetical protein